MADHFPGGRHCALVLRRWSSEATPTEAQLWALPRIVVDGASEYGVFNEALMHCFLKAGDSDYIPGESCLLSFNTWSSTRQVRLMSGVLDEFVEKPLRSRKKKKKQQEKHAARTAFLRLLAVTQTLEGDNLWYWDQEEPKDVNQLMKTLHRLWTRVLEQPDGELGLCGENAREQLLDFLRRFGAAVLSTGEEMGVEPDLYKFPWTWK